MTEAITLRGMTWSHPRGYEPLVACAAVWKERTGVEVIWDKRSLQDFESFPVEELARTYDLIVIDHPHVGQVTAEGCLLRLDRPGREAEGHALARASVGRSFASYNFNGAQWALPIDAATQVQAWRPDLIPEPARTWDDAMALAGRGKVLVPLLPPHSLMVFCSLAANLGHACAGEAPDVFVDAEAGDRVYGMMRDLMAAIGPASYAMDPIAAYEAMSSADSSIACVPLAYGYVSYACAGFRDRRLAFADIPPAGDAGPIGTVLGGTGVAVSARTAHPEAAIDLAYWLAGEEAQRGPYAAAGGQPGHAAAWDDPAINARHGNFYKDTRATLEGAWVRPRHNGYMAFQAAASVRINEALRDGEPGAAVIADLNRRFRKSFG